MRQSLPAIFFVFLILTCTLGGRAQPAAVTARVDGGTVAVEPADRNLMVATAITELGQWRDLDSANIKVKSAAISYVILRRTLRGTSHKNHTIKGTILAAGQFNGLTVKQEGSGSLKGRAEAHAALAILDPNYRQEIETRAHKHSTEFIRSILHLLPSDTTTGEDAAKFQAVVQAAAAGVNSAISGQGEDPSHGALFFGGVGDIFRSRHHQPKRIVTYVGDLGPYSSLDALLKDRQIRSSMYRDDLRDAKGVNALFFFN